MPINSPLAPKKPKVDASGQLFSGMITDAAGRKQYYRNGEHVAGPQEAAAPKAPAAAQPSPAPKQTPKTQPFDLEGTDKPPQMNPQVQQQDREQKTQTYANQMHQKFGDKAHAKIDEKLAELSKIPGSKARREALKAVKAKLPNKFSGDLHGKIIGALDKANLSDEQKQEYKGYATSALNAMPKKAHALIEKNLDRTEYFGDTKSLGMTITANPEVMERVKSGQAEVGGYYRRSKKMLALDGGSRADDGVGLYAHEMTHAIDGPDFSISSSPEWMDAYSSEFKDGQLTKYGGTKPQEALAEFGRALYGHKTKVDELRKYFPKAVAIFEKHGLLPE